MNAILTSAEEGIGPGQLSGSPFWLDLGQEKVYGVLHTPLPGAEAGSPASGAEAGSPASGAEARSPARPGSGTAALLLPPFGWDNDCSYRSRRDWATALAVAGITALRIDLPGSENSVGSPTDPGRMEAWLDATAAAALWLRAHSQSERLVAIGIGLGGMVAYQAAAAGAAIDDLILWGVRARGRAYLRELTTFAAVMAEGIDEPAEPKREDGAIGIGGHLLSAETIAALSELDLTTQALPDAESRDVLLIERDAHGVDDRLRRRLEQLGASVTVMEADDYHRLMAPAELDMTPRKTIAASTDWLRTVEKHRWARRAPRDDDDAHPVSVNTSSTLEADEDTDEDVDVLAYPRACGSIEFSFDGVPIREHAREFSAGGNRLVGVLSEPVTARCAPYCLVVLNCAAMRNTGPSRIFVEIARRATADGVPVARFDLPGLGDSDGTVARVFERTVTQDAGSVEAISGIYDQLERWGFGERFIVTGLCLGGYLCVRALLADPRSVGGIALNAPAFTWTEMQTHRVLRDQTAFAGAELTEAKLAQEPSPGPLRMLRERLAQVRYLAEARASRHLVALTPLWRFVYREGIAGVSRDLDQLGETGSQLLLLLSEDEALFRMLALPALARKLRRWPNVRLETLPTRDHVLRPLWIQALVLERVGRALREFGSNVEVV